VIALAIFNSKQVYNRKFTGDILPSS